MMKYSIQIIWSEKKKAYIATVPELREVVAIAETSTQAISALNEAVEAYLNEKQLSQEPVSPPRLIESYSGQFRLRLPRILHATLVREAGLEGISLNTYILYLLGLLHAQQQTFRQAESVFASQMNETILHMHELVSNITVSSGLDSSNFSWQNDSTRTITQIQ